MRHVIVGAETIVISQVHQGFLKHNTIASWTCRGFGQQVVCDLRIASRVMRSNSQSNGISAASGVQVSHDLIRRSALLSVGASINTTFVSSQRGSKKSRLLIHPLEGPLLAQRP